jgi:hypothetical protein
VEQEPYKGSTTTVRCRKTGIDIALVCIAAMHHNNASSKQKTIPGNAMILVL